MPDLQLVGCESRIGIWVTYHCKEGFYREYHDEKSNDNNKVPCQKHRHMGYCELTSKGQVVYYNCTMVPLVNISIATLPSKFQAIESEQ